MIDALFFDLGVREVDDMPISRVVYWFDRAVARRKKVRK